MKIRQVKAFLAVVKTGSVRRASVELNLTQSTVAKAVSQLEAELGSPLFERSAQGLRLNEAGESLLPPMLYLSSLARCLIVDNP